MKKLIAGLLLVSSVAMADTSNNPDKVPSIGVDFTQAQSNLSLNAQQFYDAADDTHNYQTPKSDVKSTNIVFDVRVPVSNWVSFSVHGGPSRIEAFSHRESGYSLGAGVRVYLQNVKQ